MSTVVLWHVGALGHSLNRPLARSIVCAVSASDRRCLLPTVLRARAVPSLWRGCDLLAGCLRPGLGFPPPSLRGRLLWPMRTCVSRVGWADGFDMMSRARSESLLLVQCSSTGSARIIDLAMASFRPGAHLARSLLVLVCPVCLWWVHVRPFSFLRQPACIKASVVHLAQKGWPRAHCGNVAVRMPCLEQKVCMAFMAQMLEQEAAVDSQPWSTGSAGCSSTSRVSSQIRLMSQRSEAS